MMHQTPGGWYVSGLVERKKKREWVTCLHDHSLAVAGSRAGIEAHVYSNKLSVKCLPSQDLWCGGIMVSAVR